MRFYLVRHGVAVDRIDGDIKNDFQRPLTPDGRHESELVASGLKKLGVKPDVLITSPLVRARQTCEVFAEVLNYKNEPLICEALAPGGSISDIYKMAKVYQSANEYMFFGHEPDMMRFAQTLLWSSPELEIPFKKSGVCRIDVADIPPTMPGVLKWFITPKIAKLAARS
ncbi:MAG: phosphohistidine phosphatase SixA [Candidatus Obscuribacterales bacterium]|nr:phosphohistidine phosphatase SixA [Candidatus Obscuribacterales bacterium]